MKRYAIATGTVALCLGLAACGSAGGSASSAASTPAPVSSSASTTPATASGIVIMNYGYTGTLSVKAGATITVVNMDSVAHTLTDKATKKFDTGNIAGSGGTGTFVAPTTPGSYPFGCTYHPMMAGTLVVTG